jgi:hypothetical protein
MVASTASAEWKEKVLYSFQGLPDGSVPAGGLVFDTHGNLYGATTEGGSNSCPGIAQCGTVYQLTPPATKGDAWTETVLYIFLGKNHNDGNTPAGGVMIDAAGNLYGTTAYGGGGSCILLGTNVGCGTVYELSPPTQKGGAWTETVIYNFKGNTDGQLPIGDLVFDKQGNLYGATQYGGGYGSCNPSFYQHCGTIFKLSPPKTKGGKWTEKVLHGFKGGTTDGATPNGGLVLDSTGAIYGTTSAGGNTNCMGAGFVGCGTVFELAPANAKGGAYGEKILRRFLNYPTDGARPLAGLTFDGNGCLYGTTADGGAYEEGTAFKLAPPRRADNPWIETLLHQFTSGADGSLPSAGLVFRSDGTIYGTASGGGRVGGGTVFQFRHPLQGGWVFGPLYTFSGSPDGSYPASSLIFDRSGKLYGTTQMSGNTEQNCGHNGCGTVFEVRP